MGTNTKVVRSLIWRGPLAFAMLLVLCAAAWVPSAYADGLVVNQGNIAAGGNGYDPEAAVHDLSKCYCDYKEYPIFSYKGVTLEDLAITFYRYDEAGNKVTLASSDYGDPTWYRQEAGVYTDNPFIPGPYELTLHGKGAYAGSSHTLSFRIVDDDSFLLASVEGVEPYYMYTGEKIQPTPELVMPDGTVIDKKTYTCELDYFVSISHEVVDALQGPGLYLYEFRETSPAQKQVFFNTQVFTESERISLEDESIRVVGLDASYPYTGSAIKPPIIVRDFSGKLEYFADKKVYDLVEGRDYTIAYKDNVKGKTATITIIGQGLYKGSLTKTFTIKGVPEAKPKPDPQPKPQPKPKPQPRPKPQPKPKGIDVGKTAKIGGATYKVTNNAKSTVVYQKAPKNKRVVVIPATVKINDKTYAVVGIMKKAFRGAKAKKVTIKTRKLMKKSVKSCFKGAKKLKTVKVKVGSKKANRKFVKKYKRIFTKRNCGKKVTVK